MAKVKDRLPELHAKQQLLDDTDKKSKSKSKKGNVATDMEALQKQVREVEAKLTTLKRNVKEMETLQKNILSSPFCDKKEVQKYEQIVNHVQQVSTGEDFRLNAVLCILILIYYRLVNFSYFTESYQYQ